MKTYSKSQDAVGQKFGKLIVIKLLQFDKNGQRKVLCICECGNDKIASLPKLKNGNTKSCGCLRTANALNQLNKACELNPKIKGKSDPRIATAKIVFRRYSDGDLSFDDFLQLSQCDCYYCGLKPSNTSNYYITNDSKNNKYSNDRKILGYFTYNGLDRVDNNQLHNKNNVVPCCYYCNRAKLDRTKEDFFKWVQLVHALHIQK